MRGRVGLPHPSFGHRQRAKKGGLPTRRRPLPPGNLFLCWYWVPLPFSGEEGDRGWRGWLRTGLSRTPRMRPLLSLALSSPEKGKGNAPSFSRATDQGRIGLQRNRFPEAREEIKLAQANWGIKMKLRTPGNFLLRHTTCFSIDLQQPFQTNIAAPLPQRHLLNNLGDREKPDATP
jgi:hypothetical protein